VVFLRPREIEDIFQLDEDEQTGDSE
jgi:hypothetical protein